MAVKSTFSSMYSTFRDLLIEARKKSGLTQVELSQQLSKPQSFVSKYESGERRLDLIEFLEIADVLNINPNNFITDLLNSK